MSVFIGIVILLAVASVAVILMAGLVNMSRSGSANLSQQLMRWRVGMQFVAICLVMVSFYLTSS